MRTSDVCIIGAGTSGIVAAKVLHGRGIRFDWYEKGSGVGGLWRYNNDNGQSVIYSSLHINTSRKLMELSGFPMPREYPDYPHHSQILKYLEAIVDHFELHPHLSLRTAVEKVTPLPEGDYEVRLRFSNGTETRRRYRSVLVANGHHWCPHLPAFPGNFTGETLHSHHYRTPDSYRGKRVMVVGLGNSACDIVCELSRVAERTILSARRGVHVLPKYLFGKPLDRLWPRFMWRHSPL